ncbi:type II secretion system protein [Campylobacter sp. RM16192]|uniref:type II secretion system protein n=1 Tax=Campylobacter sp. RM16192 TaxID=1660080 RepID=UPI001553586D|nr:prepilin-type N-terminal cleavage/methylation domain-containing protein [Campylobacter sp. RM16192]
MKKAFTLIELIVVLVITGIISVLSTDIILNIYRGYLQSRAINTLEAQTEIALEQIAKRLMFRIKGSTIGRKSDGNFISTSDAGLNQDYIILEWIAYSYESFQDSGWSGFVDTEHTNTIPPTTTGGGGGKIETPYSKLDNANDTISDLTNKQATLSNGKVGIYFRGTGSNVINTSFGYDKVNANSIGTVNTTTGSTTNLTIPKYKETEISEYYYLLHTAYAIAPGKPSADGDSDLILHYNYRPWLLGADNQYNGKNSNSAIIATNVTRFNFKEIGNMIVLKLCIRDAGRSLRDGEEETTVCKTKAIY